MKRQEALVPLAAQPITGDVLREKYLKEGKYGVEDLFARVAAAPASVEECPECGAHATIRRDGCDYCTHCGHIGACG